MQYKNLRDLLSCSSSARRFCLSLPQDIRMQLNRHGEFIHSAADLHLRAGLIAKHMHAVEISEDLDRFLK